MSASSWRRDHARRPGITPQQTSDDLGFNLVKGDNLPEPCVLLAHRGNDSDRVRKTMQARTVVHRHPDVQVPQAPGRT
ncbi:hypothetical protein GCM10010991_35600 [Gemmobacter aquaticus]|uniref:Uncharacterized protein n=1 Tax=Gemmobacter aquaticus TaxID=490185 RepID=A0A917YQE7_9RHOB|nr:hypothetical protein GCM10010991_35600 [Gemmobacter aquaticus]